MAWVSRAKAYARMRGTGIAARYDDAKWHRSERWERLEPISLGEMERKKRKMIHIALALIAGAAALYWVVVYFLVSAALVPSFMRKLEAFERITEESYAMQVSTSEIQENRSAAREETKRWLEGAECRKLGRVTEDGYRLVAEEFPASEESHQWALILHGYTGWKEEMHPFARQYHERGYHVLVPDLRCHGESEGDFIGMGWTDHLDAGLWLDYILERDPEAAIVIHGQSMGASTALMMAGEENLSAHVAAIISDCAYTDALSMFGEKIRDWFGLPAFPFVDSARLMLKLRGGYDLKDASALEAVKKSVTPILFIHGEADAMISAEMSKELYEAAGCEKKLLLIAGAGHGQSQDKDPAAYYGTVFQFIQESRPDLFSSCHAIAP